MAWGFISSLPKEWNIIVITECKWKADIEKVHLENVTFHYIKRRRADVLRKLWPPSYYWFYNFWQRKVLRLAVKLHMIECFDIVHQLNMVGFREPGYLHKLDLPTVWGPIGGLENTPLELFSTMPMSAKLRFFSRNVINSYQKRFQRRSASYAKGKRTEVLYATEGNQREGQKNWMVNGLVLSEIGMKRIPVGTDNLQSVKIERPLKIVFSGQLIDRKNVRWLIDLLVADASNDWTLEIIGDGPRKRILQKLAKSNKVDERIVWHGRVSRQKSLELIKASDVMIIASVSELTSTVAVEAISLGIPLIGFNSFGYGELIKASGGIAVELASRDKMIKDFVNGIRMFRDNNFYQKSSLAAFNYSNQFLWTEKMNILIPVYEKLTKK